MALPGKTNRDTCQLPKNGISGNWESAESQFPETRLTRHVAMIDLEM